MTKLLKLLAVAALVAVVPATAGATIIWDTTVGTNPPPATVGGIPVYAFPDDPRPEFSVVSDVADPWGHSAAVLFSNPTSLRTVGSGWATWSHGYTGDVYFAQGLTSLTLTLIPTRAFYFYLEPNPFATFTFTATANGVSAVLQSVSGTSGAKFFGVFGGAGERIDTISVSSSTDFAVGEFGVAAPEPGTLLLVGSGVSALLLRRRRRA